MYIVYNDRKPSIDLEMVLYAISLIYMASLNNLMHQPHPTANPLLMYLQDQSFRSSMRLNHVFLSIRKIGSSSSSFNQKLGHIYIVFVFNFRNFRVVSWSETATCEISHLSSNLMAP